MIKAQEAIHRLEADRDWLLAQLASAEARPADRIAESGVRFGSGVLGKAAPVPRLLTPAVVCRKTRAALELLLCSPWTFAKGQSVPCVSHCHPTLLPAN